MSGAVNIGKGKEKKNEAQYQSNPINVKNDILNKLENVLTQIQRQNRIPKMQRRKKRGLTFFVQFNGLESDSELLKQLFDTHAERTKRFAAININIDVRIKIKPRLWNNSTAASIGKRKT